MTRVDFGVKAAAGFPAFDSLVDFIGWYVLDSHVEFLLLGLLDEGRTRNRVAARPLRAGLAVTPQGKEWQMTTVRHTPVR